MRIGLNVTGATEWARALNQLPEELQKRVLYAALHRSAGVIQQALKNAAPLGTEPTRKTRRVGTGLIGRGRKRLRVRLSAPRSVSYDYGRLRQNIIRRRLNVRRSGQIGVEITRGRAFWAFFLEKGTSRMRPHPFWHRAAAAAEARALAVFAEQFRTLTRVALARVYQPPRR